MAQNSNSIQRLVGFPTEEQGFDKGVSACYCGVINGNLYIAGGCNFPDKPVAEGGKKRFYKAIYAAKLNAEGNRLEWKTVGQMPQPAAYGVSVTYENSLIFVGGNNETGGLTTAIRLRPTATGMQQEALPSLPHALDNMAGAVVGHILYVVGGNCEGVATQKVWSLDLKNTAKEGWKEELSIPGIARVQPIAAALAGDLLGVWGGFAPKTDSKAAQLAMNGASYNAGCGTWTALPVPTDALGEEVFTGGSTAIATPQKGVVVVGGVNKDVFLAAINKLPEGYLLHEPEWYRFNNRVLCYRDGTWTQLLQHPSVARAGCVLAYWDGWVYIVGGELKPGIRTPEIVRFRVD
jgi:cyclically-permuted mutatrotase family protein